MASWSERMGGESAKAFRAFCLYRDMGPDRSLDKVALVLYPTKEGQRGRKRPATGTLQGWSSDFEWVRRAYDYDRHCQALEVQGWERERREITSRRIAISKRMLEIVSGCLDHLNPEDLPINQLPRWVEACGKIKIEIGEQEVAGDETDKKELERLRMAVQGYDELFNDPDMRNALIRFNAKLHQCKRPPTRFDSESSTDGCTADAVDSVPG